MFKSPGPMLRQILLAISLSLVFSIANAASKDKPVALVTDMFGQALISNKQQPVHLLDYLHEDDQLEVTDKSSLVLVYLDTGLEYSLTGPGSCKLQQAELDMPGGIEARQRHVLNDRIFSLAPLHDSKKPTTSPAVVLTKPEAIYPDQMFASKTLETHPSFSWQAPDDILHYRFQLHDQDGKILYSRIIRQTSLQLPSAVRLKAGEKYTWNVSAPGHPGSMQFSAWFQIATARENNIITAIIKKPTKTFSERILKASLLDYHGFHDDANTIWQQLAQERTDQPVLQDRLNSYHSQQLSLTP